MHFLYQLNLEPRLLYTFSNYFNSQVEISLLKERMVAGNLNSTIITGNSGSGVTHVLCAICNELVKTGRRLMYITTQSFLYVIKKLRTPDSLLKFENELLKFDVIAIDNVQHLYRKAKKIGKVFFDLLRKCVDSKKIILIGRSDSLKDITKSNRNFRDLNFDSVKIKELSTRDIYLALNSNCSAEDNISGKLLYAISGYNGTVQEHINCLVSIRFSDKLKNINTENYTIEQLDELFELKKYFPVQQFRKCFRQVEIDFGVQNMSQTKTHDIGRLPFTTLTKEFLNQ